MDARVKDGCPQTQTYIKASSAVNVCGKQFYSQQFKEMAFKFNFKH
jgi:hypothetical protein